MPYTVDTLYGVRASSDWATNVVPESWRAAIFMDTPLGRLPLTGITSMMKEEKLDSFKHHWWAMGFPEDHGAFTATEVYSDALVTKVTGDITAGTTYYVQLTEALAGMFRVRQQIGLGTTGSLSNEFRFRVSEQPTLNGASSYLKMVALISTSGQTIQTANYVRAIGSGNEEHAQRATGIHYDETEMWNWSTIERTPLDLSRTALQTTLRTGPAYRRTKRSALYKHGEGIERKILFGHRAEVTGPTEGKKERYNDGLIRMLQRYNSSFIYDFKTDADVVAGAGSWLTYGSGWLREKLTELAVWMGDGEDILAVTGSAAILGLEEMAISDSTYNIGPQTRSFGLKVKEFITSAMTMDLRTHALFSLDATLKNAVLLIKPRLMHLLPMQDTVFVNDANREVYQNGGVPQNRNSSRDGVEEEFLTEFTLQYDSLTQMALFLNVGVDKT